MPEVRSLASRSESAARLSYELSARHCRDCRSYHAIWPYLRLTQPLRGVDADRDRLQETLAPLLQPGCSVLLAGSADAGLAECVLDAGRNHPMNLTVLDLCETPLRQCVELLGPRTGGQLQTLRASIAGIPVSPPVDLIVAHSVLSFLTGEDVTRAAGFLSASLRPGGRLVMTTAIGRRSLWGDPVAFRDHVLADLSAQGITLPDEPARFGTLLEGYIQGRVARESPFADRPALLRWLAAAGLDAERIDDLARGTGYAPGAAPSAKQSDGVLVVARKAEAP